MNHKRMEDLIMKKLRFVLIGFTLMLGLAWCATANAQCVSLCISPTDAGPGDDISLTLYVDGVEITVRSKYRFNFP